MVEVCADQQALVGSPRPIPSPGWFAAEIRAYARAVLEAAAEVQEKYGPIERSDEVAERIRALKEDL